MGFIVEVIELPRKDAADVLKLDGENVLRSCVGKKETSYLFLTKRIIKKYPDKDVQYVKVKEFLQEVNEVNNLACDDVIENYLTEVWKKDKDLVREYITGQAPENMPSAKVMTMANIVDSYLDEIRKSKGFRIKTGYQTADEICEGLFPQRSDILILLGFTGSGKTAFALNMINNISELYPYLPMVFFSLEMQAEDILERLAMISCGVKRWEVEKAFKLKTALFEDICVTLMDKFKNLRIIDEGSLKVQDMDAIIRDLSLKEFDEPVKLIFIDHLDYIHIPYLSGVSFWGRKNRYHSEGS